MKAERSAARHEWQRSWPLPFAAALGFSSGGLHIYGIGPFVEPLQREFGWTRAETLGGLAIVSIGIALASIPLGLLVDRYGPRAIGLVGVLLMGASVALLGSATGGLTNWILLWAIIALCSVSVQSLVWTSAVVNRFDAARGMAIGTTLCGASLGVFLFPMMSTWLLQHFGWRAAFFGLGGIWALILLPILFLFFRGSPEREEHRQKLPMNVCSMDGLSLRQALLHPTLYKLCIASAFFAFAMIGCVVHFIPMLTDAGASPMTAAGMAALIGVFSLIGRLGTGALLDRFPAQIIGTISFLVPIPGCLLLLAPDIGGAGLPLSAMCLGLTLGAETDVIIYLATRHFGLRNFGAIQGALLCAIAIGSAIGPLAAGLTFDRFGNYAPFLTGVSLLMLVSAVIMASTGRPPEISQVPPVSP